MHSPNHNICKPDRTEPQKTTIGVYEPRCFEEAAIIARQLVDGNSVSLNLRSMDADQAQRSIDFIAGACFAVDGSQEAIAESIFFLSPASTKITVPTAKPKALPPAAVVDEHRSWWSGLCSVLLGGF
jgi:FtsZ-interacting cell division protein YlmF